MNPSIKKTLPLTISFTKVAANLEHIERSKSDSALLRRIFDKYGIFGLNYPSQHVDYRICLDDQLGLMYSVWRICLLNGFNSTGIISNTSEPLRFKDQVSVFEVSTSVVIAD